VLEPTHSGPPDVGLERARHGRAALHARGGRDAADVLGRGPAAAADEAHAQLAEAPREHPEVLGRRHVDEAIVDAAGQARVGHGRERHAQGQQLLDRREHDLRPVGAVDAHHGGAVLDGALGHLEHLAAVGEREPLVDRHLRDDRHPAAARERRPLERERELFGLAHGLDHQAVDALFEQRVGLLVEGSAHAGALVVGEAAAEDEAGGAHGAAHVGAALRRLAGELGGLSVELAHFVVEAVPREAKAVGPEGVGLDELRAGAHVVFVHPTHELAPRDHELFVVDAEQHAALVELRAHAAVDHDDAALERLFERPLGVYRRHRRAP
jgi:hypothetical protein